MIERGTKKYLPNQDRKIRKAKKEKKKSQYKGKTH